MNFFDEEEEMKCSKCKKHLHGLGDDYWCPECQESFCYDCIENHGCRVETYSVGNKTNYVRLIES